MDPPTELIVFASGFSPGQSHLCVAARVKTNCDPSLTKNLVSLDLSKQVFVS